MKEQSRRFLRHDAGFSNRLDIGQGAAVANRRLVRVHLHDRVIDAKPGEGRKHMLDGVHPDRAFADRCRALNRFHVGYRGVDRRLVLQILALKFDPGIRGAGWIFSDTFAPVWSDVPLSEAALASVC